MSGLVPGWVKNSNPDPIPINKPYPVYRYRVCNGFATGSGAGAGFHIKQTCTFIYLTITYPTRGTGRNIHANLHPSFISFALPFLLSPAALTRRAAAISASEDSPTQHQSPKHINAQIEDDQRRLRRWLMRIRPRLKDRTHLKHLDQLFNTRPLFLR